MGMDLRLKSTTLSAPEDHSWLGKSHGTDTCDPITLDGDAFLTSFTDGIIPSGVALAKVTSTGKYRQYAGKVNEQQVVTVDATSGTYTLTFDGETTAAIAEGATAAAVKSALEGLSNINPGDVTVTGATGGPYTVTFTGAYAGLNVPQMTATDVDLAGGGDSVTVTTSVAGGSTASDGTEVFAGHLYTTVDLRGTTSGEVGDVAAALFHHGEVVESKLPSGHGLDAAAKAAAASLGIFIRYV